MTTRNLLPHGAYVNYTESTDEYEYYALGSEPSQKTNLCYGNNDCVPPSGTLVANWWQFLDDLSACNDNPGSGYYTCQELETDLSPPT